VPAERVKLDAAPFYKRTHGTVRASTDPADMGMLVNLGNLTMYGVDTSVRAQLHPVIATGASYEYIKAHSDDTGDDPLDRLPHHRADAWLQAAPHRRLALIARVRYYGDAIDKTKPVSSYTLVEASASAELSREYLAVLRVDDLLDVRPETRGGYHAPGRVITLVLQGQWQ
jgi:outer membrane cobalamin receptor